MFYKCINCTFIHPMSCAVRPIVNLNHHIHIKSPAARVFDYIADLNNDHLWRPEVERMEVLDEGKPGTVVIEYITVYKLFHITTPVKIIKMDFPHLFEIETMNNHPYWVHCKRTITPINESESKITVELSFTLDNLKQVFPLLPPKWVVYQWYNPRMKRYLKNLKRILEE